MCFIVEFVSQQKTFYFSQVTYIFFGIDVLVLMRAIGASGTTEL